MFRTLICPSSGACHYSVELPHWSYCSWFDVCWSIRVAGFSLQHSNTDTTPTQPRRNSNTHRTKNNTTNVVIQQNSGKLLMMDILKSETCWAHKKWNKIASDIKLVFYSSSITMMHGPINIIFNTLVLPTFLYGSGNWTLTKTKNWSGRNEVTETSGRLHHLWPQNKRLHTPRTTDYRHTR